MSYNDRLVLGSERENMERLGKCPAHDFRHHRGGARFQCRRCGGVATAEARFWYDLGMQDGRKVERIAREVAAAKAGAEAPR